MGETLLIVGIVESRELALRTAAERGLHIVAVDFAVSALAQMAHVHIPVADLFDPAQLAPALKRAAAEHRPGAVMTFYDELLEPTAHLAQRLGCRFLSPHAAKLAFNKVVQRPALRQGGLLCPQWIECDDIESVRQAANLIGYPVIIKVADQAGSIGKVRVFDETQLATAFAETDVTRIDRSMPMLVEELVVGTEYSVEGFVTHEIPTLICVTRKTTAAGPHPVVMGHALPYTGPDCDAVAPAALQAVKALGVNDSMFHTEVTVTARGPILIEVNARSSGDKLMDLIHVASGRNPYHVAFDLALGHSPVWQPDWQRGAAQRWIGPESSGIFTEVLGVETVAGHPRLRGIGLASPLNTYTETPARHNGERLAWISCDGADWLEADATSKEIVARLAGRVLPVPDQK